MVLLSPHHVAVHNGKWTIHTINGTHYFQPAPWLEPIPTTVTESSVGVVAVVRIYIGEMLHRSLFDNGDLITPVLSCRHDDK